MGGIDESSPALPFLVAAVLSVGSILLWQALDAEQDRLVAVTSRAMAGGVASAMATDLTTRRQALDRMADRWRELGRPQREVWLADAALYVVDGVTPLGLVWLDDSRVPRWWVDEAGEARGASTFEVVTGLEEATSRARRTGRPSYAALTAGDLEIAAVHPLTAQGRSDGYLVGLFQAADLFGLPFGASAESFGVRVRDGAGEIVYESVAAEFDAADPIVVTREIAVGADAWTLEVVPSGPLVANLGSSTPEIVLALGLVLALIAGWAVLAWQRGSRSARELEHFHAISLDGLCISDFDGRFLRVNPAMGRILQRPEEELLATPFLDLVHPEDVESTVQAMSALGEGAHVISFENRYRMGDETYRWISWNAVPTRDGERIHAVARDVTERRELVDELSHTRDELRERARTLAETADELSRSNEDLQQFAYVASHDLQEPLRMVAGYTELLAKRYKGRLDDDADDFIDFAVDGARRMKDLITSLLEFSRVHSQGSDFESTDLEVVLDAVRRDLGHRIEESGAEITSGPLPSVNGDPVQLAQLLQNLLANALKFSGSDDRPRVHVEAQRGDGEWQISVRDNGIGIDPRHASRIFEIFQRLHGRGEYPGTGIGLAICRRIVQRHGGRIWVESEAGAGSTFHFTLADDPSARFQSHDAGAAA